MSDINDEKLKELSDRVELLSDSFLNHLIKTNDRIQKEVNRLESLVDQKVADEVNRRLGNEE